MVRLKEGSSWEICESKRLIYCDALGLLQEKKCLNVMPQPFVWTTWENGGIYPDQGGFEPCTELIQSICFKPRLCARFSHSTTVAVCRRKRRSNFSTVLVFQCSTWVFWVRKTLKESSTAISRRLNLTDAKWKPQRRNIPTSHNDSRIFVRNKQDPHLFSIHQYMINKVCFQQ